MAVHGQEREQLARGVTAVSAGNHAMAVGYAARALGTTAKVVMPKNANPARVQGSRDYGAEVELVAWHVKPGPGLVSQRGHGMRPSVGPVR